MYINYTYKTQEEIRLTTARIMMEAENRDIDTSASSGGSSGGGDGDKSRFRAFEEDGDISIVDNWADFEDTGYGAANAVAGGSSGGDVPNSAVSYEDDIAIGLSKLQVLVSEFDPELADVLPYPDKLQEWIDIKNQGTLEQMEYGAKVDELLARSKPSWESSKASRQETKAGSESVTLSDILDFAGMALMGTIEVIGATPQGAAGGKVIKSAGTALSKLATSIVQVFGGKINPKTAQEIASLAVKAESKAAKYASNSLNLSADGGKIHGNSLMNMKQTHVYKIVKDGKVFKIGESSQGLTSTGLSKRAEMQVRRLNRMDGDSYYESLVLRVYPNKATARVLETKLIGKIQDRSGAGALPGNKTNR